MIGRLLWGRLERRTDASIIPGPLDIGSGGSGYGLPSDDRAMRHSAVWAAVALRSGLMSTFPPHAYRDEGGRRVRRPTPPLLRVPKPGPAGSGMSIGELAAMVERALLLRGNFYALIARDFAMRPVSVDPLHPDRVQPSSRKGRLVYVVDRSKVVQPEDMWHLRRHVPEGGVEGLSAISYARVSIELGLMAEKFGADFFRDGAHPTGLLRTKAKLTDDQVRAAKERWIKALRGAREPAVMGDGWEYSAVQVNPEDSQFLDAIGANTATVARFMGAPVELIGGSVQGAGLTYANLPDRGLHLLTFHMQPAIETWEDGLTELLPGGRAAGTYCKVATDAVLRLDPKTQAEVNAIRLKNAETNPDELRALRDLPPLPDKQGEVFVWPPTIPAPILWQPNADPRPTDPKVEVP